MKTFEQLRSVWNAGYAFALVGIAVMVGARWFEESRYESFRLAALTGFGMVVMGAATLNAVRISPCPACGKRFGERYVFRRWRSIGGFGCAHCGAKSDSIR